MIFHKTIPYNQMKFSYVQWTGTCATFCKTTCQSGPNWHCFIKNKFTKEHSVFHSIFWDPNKIDKLEQPPINSPLQIHHGHEYTYWTYFAKSKRVFLPLITCLWFYHFLSLSWCCNQWLDWEGCALLSQESSVPLGWQNGLS